MATTAKPTAPVPVDTYNKTQVAAFYNISTDTLNAWTEEIKELGNYRGKRYTLKQVEMIFEHCGYPEQ
jgi:hypothetical protein